MPEIVTIEGTVTPCVELGRFERKTVEMDDHVRKLVTRGYVRIVARHGDPEAELAALADEDVVLAPDPVTPAEVAAPDPPELADLDNPTAV
jgi:hypothetical protein